MPALQTQPVATTMALQLGVPGAMPQPLNMQPRQQVVFIMPVAVPYRPGRHVPGDSSESDADTQEIGSHSALLSLRRPHLIQVLEYCVPRASGLSAARLSTFSDQQLCQLAVVTVGISQAQRSAEGCGVHTIGGLKRIMKAHARELRGWASVAASMEAIEPRARALGYTDAMCGVLSSRGSYARPPRRLGQNTIALPPPLRRLRQKTTVAEYAAVA